MEFQVDPTTRVPIYRQLMDQVRLAVARGRMKPGSRLPSVRVLSRELVVNPNTIARRVYRVGAGRRAEHAAGIGRFRRRAAGGTISRGTAARLAEIIDGFLDRRRAFGILGR